jgi:hypothetical protein
MRTLLLTLGLLFLFAAPAAATEVTFDRPTAGMGVGQRVTLLTRITNPGSEPTGSFVAHLDVVSLTPDVTVDPEDWSSERSQDVDALEPGETRELSWPVQAVAAGTFDAYVVLAPTVGPGPVLVTATPAHLEVAGRRELGAGGALPVVLIMPVLLGLGAAAMRYRLRGIR